MARRRGFWLLLIAVAAFSATGVALASRPAPAGRQIARIMDQPQYSHAQWGMLEVDPRTGRTVRSMQPRKAFIPGSVAKLFVVSTAWNVLGPQHRFTTPVYALGTRTGSTLDGNLVLQAQGDLTMGGRTTPKGNVAYRDIDHTYANSVPGAELTRENPLAGLNQIARRVRAAGITHVDGDVAIDDRLWGPDPNLVGEDPGTDPMVINDNVIDVLVTPTKPGQPAKLDWRPQTAAIHVSSTVTTGKPAKDPAAYPYPWQLTQSSPQQVVAGGTIPANAKPELLVFQIPDPASFARTALIEALARAGVTVNAPAVEDNPAHLLPARDSYSPGDRVAAYRSPPFRQYARLILKVSHNLGAQESLCLLAANAGSHNCQRGLHVERRFLKRAGVNVNEVALADGRGGDPNDRATPRAMVQLLQWWMTRPDFHTFKRSLPILGVNGDLGVVARHSPARGKVFAKTGTAAGPDFLNNRLVVGKTMAGYLGTKHGRPRPFALMMNNGFFPLDVEQIFVASRDLAHIAALMQQHEPK